MNEFIEII